MERVHIIVHGEVHGIGFRSFTQRMAEELGLVGWVRNDSDGTVEAVAEGTREALEEFVSRLKKGPPASRVQSVEVNWAKPTEEFTDFQIRLE